MGKYSLSVSNKFKKDFRKCEKHGLDMHLLREAMEILESNGGLPDKYRPHKLSNFKEDCWECHLGGRNSDWLMIWQQNDLDLTLLMLRTGTHSDIF